VAIGQWHTVHGLMLLVHCKIYLHSLIIAVVLCLSTR